MLPEDGLLLSWFSSMSAARVLVAEDDRVVSMLVSRSLEASGARVTAVYDGIDAYEMGKTGEFDIALLDQVMPGLLGAEVLQRWSERAGSHRTSACATSFGRSCAGLVVCRTVQLAAADGRQYE